MENTKKVITEFKERVQAEVRRQERIKVGEENDIRRVELSGKYIAKLLYG